MTTPQSAIIPDHCTAGIWIQANILDRSRIQAACHAALTACHNMQQRYPTEQIGLTIAFGADFWRSLNHTHEATELKNFPSYGKGSYLAPATQTDLLIHIQSLNHDSNFTLAYTILNAFSNSIEVTEETHGFRRHEERGLDGFVDGTENPQGDADIQNVAIDQYGGSYVLFQKYQHHLHKWDSYSIPQQEETIARHKISNEEFPKTERHPQSHIARTNLRENDVKLKIVRRSLPFGLASGVHGLAFTAYCARLHNIEVQLQHMFGDSEDGLTDLILHRMASAISGAYYYAPSVERLQQL